MTITQHLEYSTVIFLSWYSFKLPPIFKSSIIPFICSVFIEPSPSQILKFDKNSTSIEVVSHSVRVFIHLFVKQEGSRTLPALYNGLTAEWETLTTELPWLRQKIPPATQEMWVQPLGLEDLLEETATHSSILAWAIPWTEEPGGLQSMGSHRVGHAKTEWLTLAQKALESFPRKLHPWHSCHCFSSRYTAKLYIVSTSSQFQTRRIRNFNAIRALGFIEFIIALLLLWTFPFISLPTALECVPSSFIINICYQNTTIM